MARHQTCIRQLAIILLLKSVQLKHPRQLVIVACESNGGDSRIIRVSNFLSHSTFHFWVYCCQIWWTVVATVPVSFSIWWEDQLAIRSPNTNLFVNSSVCWNWVRGRLQGITLSSLFTRLRSNEEVTAL